MSDLVFEKIINLTTYDKNVSPFLVHNLCMVNEPNNELVQYYIDDDGLAEDKAANIKNNNYDTVRWGNKGKRLTFRNVSRIGVKAFPGVGAVAYFKDKYRGTCNIIAPVNYEGREYMTPPILQATDNGDTLTFKIIPPPDIVYFCYRIVLDNDGFAYEYITYDLELTVDKPDVKGTYHIYCTGYINEGEYTSADSNIIDLTITKGRESFKPIPEESFYTKAEIDAMIGQIGKALDDINGEVV